jgi:hypothetical protein
MKNQQTYNKISQVLYSTLETQRNSFDLAKYVVDNDIEGDIIECGIAAGGNFATMILGAIENDKGKTRGFWGFDSFEGIQLAGKKDKEQAGIGAITHNTDVEYGELLVSSGITSHPLQQVVNNLTNWGLDNYKVHLIQGWVQNTIPQLFGNGPKTGNVTPDNFVPQVEELINKLNPKNIPPSIKDLFLKEGITFERPLR